MCKSVGIDLGTTNSLVAYHHNEKTEILVNKEGDRTTPSVFAVSKRGEVLVGRSAVDQEGTNADNTIRSVKRLMGTSEKVALGGAEWSPEVISAEILKKIKADAEAVLGDEITQAVITVPAYFDNNQRQATKVAGELAGLEVLRIINEPTAAALAYGLDSKRNETVLVYDLGGGTFDVTVLKISDIGVFEVLATAGDTKLGGDDFDESLMWLLQKKMNGECGTYHIISEMPLPFEVPYKPDAPWILMPGEEEPKTRTPRRFVRLDASAYSRFRAAAVQAKRELTSSESVDVRVDYLSFEDGMPVNLDETVTRQEFKDLILNHLAHTRDLTLQAIKDAKSDIDEVVLVGGSTRIPMVSELLEIWTGKKPNRSVNPDEAVAVGAAIQAAILSGAREKDVLLVDVTPLSLGVETLGGVMTAMIARNTVIPCERVEMFSTGEDNQAKVDIRVFQGERPQAKDNNFLGEFHLTDLLLSPRGTPQIEVKFDIDANGMLSVSATDKATGKEQTVSMTGSSRLSSEDVAKMVSDAAACAAEDEAFKERTQAVEMAHDKLRQVDELLRIAADILSEEIIDDLNDLQKSLETVMEGENHIELFHSLCAAASESIKNAGKIIYAKAQENIPQKEGDAE